MIRTDSADLYAAPTDALVRIARWLKCLPRDRQPHESEGAYRHRLVHAILREEKSLARAPKSGSGERKA